ncbi:MAG TPA: prephenate dehydrogenase/arogenate dehydrogenase family protein [Blastocatellia bacterium]
MRFRHLLVVGVGLIGGSLAMAARRLGLADRITGFDDHERLKEALSAGIIDAPEESLVRYGSGVACMADLVYLAAPVSSILSFLHDQSGVLQAGTLVTDAGSTKREICMAADESLPAGVDFVGGHPMAGSHNSGTRFADPAIFSGAPYAVVPSGNSTDDTVTRVVDFVRVLGSRPEILTPAEHDHAVAIVSHVPQLLSTALASSTISSGDVDQLIRLAGRGFSDNIRLAASDWSVWEDICRTNPDEIDLGLANIVRELELIRLNIRTGDFRALADSFTAASEFARAFLKAKSQS